MDLIYTLKTYGWNERAEEFQIVKERVFRDCSEAFKAFEAAPLSGNIIELWEAELRKYGLIRNSRRIRMRDPLGLWDENGDPVEKH